MYNIKFGYNELSFFLINLNLKNQSTKLGEKTIIKICASVQNYSVY